MFDAFKQHAGKLGAVAGFFAPAVTRMLVPENYARDGDACFLAIAPLALILLSHATHPTKAVVSKFAFSFLATAFGAQQYYYSNNTAALERGKERYQSAYDDSSNVKSPLTKTLKQAFGG